MRIVRYFPETDMRMTQPGLRRIAIRNNLNPDNIPLGEFLLFVNRKQTMFKMLTQNNVLVSYKSRRGKIHPGVFALIPRYFDGREFNYDRALREAVLADFGNTTRQPSETVWRNMNDNTTN